MSIVNVIASVAGRFPKAVMQLRTFKAMHRFVRFGGEFDKLPFMWAYVCRAEIANGNNPDWALKADKYRVRRFVADRIGERYLIPLYGAWDNPDDIDFDSLPESFILKTNNGCATNIFVHDKAALDRHDAVRRLKKALAFPYPQLTGQLHYAPIRPCVIAEQLMEQGGGAGSLTDYKVHCVNGEPVRIYVFKDRDEVTHFDFKVMAFDAEWKEYPEALTERFRSAPGEIARPECLDEMLDAARKLAAGEEYARIDFYIINGRIYFGEITLTPDTACHPAYPPTAMNPILDRIKADRRSGRSNHSF